MLIRLLADVSAYPVGLIAGEVFEAVGMKPGTSTVLIRTPLGYQVEVVSGDYEFVNPGEAPPWAGEEGGGATTKSYAPTLGIAANTASIVNILTVTIPADDWGDGETIEVSLHLRAKHDTSGIFDTSIILRGVYGASTVALATADNTGDSGAFEARWTMTWQISREGDRLNWMQPDGMYPNGATGLRNAFEGFESSASVDAHLDMVGGTTDYGAALTGQTFNTEKVLAISAQWTNADPGIEIECIGAKVTK